jgi:hypothetical protein
MTAVAIGFLTGGLFVVMFAVAIVAMLRLLAVFESAVRAHWPGEQSRAAHGATGVR